MKLPLLSALQLCALFLLIIALSACGGLGGEPRIIATIPPATAFPENFTYIANMSNGAQIYAANCTRCHGIGGAGDGELAQSGEVQNVPDFTDYQARLDQSPQDYFNVITNGRIENLMPPWGQSLSEEARWDVAFYTYTLAYTTEQVNVGAQLASTTQWSSLITDTTFASGAPQQSDTEIAAQLMQMSSDVALTDAEALALAAYARLLTLGGASVIGQVAQVPTPIATEEIIAATPTPEPTRSGAPGTVIGRVTNGTALGTVPPETIVTLHNISPDFTTETTANAPIAADGTFTFTGISLLEGANFFVTVPYRDRIFASERVRVEAGVTSLDLPVTVYDLTEDTSVISIAGMVTQIDVSASGDGLEFLQVIRFRNNSDRLFTTSLSAGETSFASLVVPLPPGSIVLGTQGQERYVVLQEQSTIVDTLPVLPNQDHLVQLLYFVPYSNGAIIEQQVNYALNGPVRVLISSRSLGLDSAQLAHIGPEIIGERQFESFGGTLNLPAGGVVGYTLNGPITAASAPVVTSNSLLPLLLIAAGSVILIFIIVMALRQRYVPRTVPSTVAPAPANKNKLIDALVRQIAELDEQHDKGQINHDLYHKRRSTLKARLTELMDE